MEDLFRSYWWLLFPLGWFVAAGWSSWLRYRRQRDTLQLIKSYADRGEPPPPELLRLYERGAAEEDEAPAAPTPGNPWGGGGREFPWQAQLALFTVLAAGFGYATYTDLYGAGEAFGIVTFVMAAVAAMFLVTGIVMSARKRR